MILTYSSLFLACLIVAMLALFFYRMISHAARSAARDRKRQNRAKNIHGDQKSHAWRNAVSHVATQNVPQTYPAMPEAKQSQSNVWPYRESKRSSVGNAYKIQRKHAAGRSDIKNARTPWGW